MERDGCKCSIACTVHGIQGKRLAVDAAESVPVSTALSVECDDTLFLGEVVSCSHSDVGWKIEIKIEQILSGLQSLMALREALLSESIPQTLGLLPLGARN